MKWIRLLDFNSYFTAAGVAAWASAAAGVAGVGASAYSASEQKKAAEEQAGIQEQARLDAQEQEQAMFDQMASDASNTGEATVQFGTIDDEEDEFGTYNDFLTPTAPSKTGLGGTSNVNAGLMI